MPLVRPAVNVISNWEQQRRTCGSIGEFLANRLGFGEGGKKGRLAGRREPRGKELGG